MGLLSRAAAAGIALVLATPATPLAADVPLGALLDRLSAPEPAARAEAACEIGQRGAAGAPAIEALVALLPDAMRVGPVECGMSPWLRRSTAAWALGEIADPSAAVPLARALKDESAEVRKQAAWALGEMKLEE